MAKQCEINGDGCTGHANLVEDPYEADIKDNPGVMIWACGNCLHEIEQDI